MIQLRILMWGDYSGLSGLAQCNHKSPYKQKSGAEEEVRAIPWEKDLICSCGFEDEEDCKPRNAGSLQKVGTAKATQPKVVFNILVMPACVISSQHPFLPLSLSTYGA